MDMELKKLGIPEALAHTGPTDGVITIKIVVDK